MKIAIVDDDRDLREVVELKLKKMGHDVLPIPNGLKLIGALRVYKPDVVLMDVLMSWIDGITLTKSMKENVLWRDIPVIVMSASHDPGLVARSLAAGAHSFLSKPFNAELLRMRIEEATGGWKADRSLRAV